MENKFGCKFLGSSNSMAFETHWRLRFVQRSNDPPRNAIFVCAKSFVPKLWNCIKNKDDVIDGDIGDIYNNDFPRRDASNV